MDELKKTLYNIAIISVTSGFFDIFTTSGRLKKYINYIISLVILTSIFHPTITMLNKLPNAFPEKTYNTTDYQSNKNEYIKSSVITSVEQNIENRLSIPTHVFSTDVTITEDSEKTLITEIRITITDKNYFRYGERIYDYLKSNFGCSVIVKQDTKE